MLKDLDNILQTIDFPSLIIKYYKAIGLNELDLAIILVINFYKTCDIPFVTNELIVEKTSLSLEEIDKIVDNLILRKLVEIKKVKIKMVTLLDGVKSLLIEKLLHDVIEVDESKKAIDKKNKIISLL